VITARRVRVDVGINTGFAVVRLAALLWVIRRAALLFAPEALGVFLLARRLASTFAHVLQLGCSQTLLRYLSMTESSKVRRRYVMVTTAAWAGLAVFTMAVFLPTRSWVAAAIFPGVDDASPLAWWTVTLTVASILSFIAYSTLFAERRLILANLLELMSVSGLLLLALFWSRAALTPAALVRFQALGLIILCVVTIATYLIAMRRPDPASGPAPTWSEAGRVLVTYGFPRGGTAALDIVVVTIGPWLLRKEPAQAGYLLMALTIVQAVPAALAPTAQIASILAARLVGRGELTRLREEVRLLLGGTLYAATLALAILLPWSRYVLQLWLGDAAIVSGVSFYLSWLVWGIVPLAFFQALRGIIEMRWLAPRNLWTLATAVTVHVLAYELVKGLVGEAASVRAALLAAFGTMGLLTFAWLDSSWWRPLRYWGLGRLVSLASFVALVNFLLAEWPGPLEALVGIVSTGVIAVVGLKGAAAPAVLAMRAFIWPRTDLESFHRA